MANQTELDEATAILSRVIKRLDGLAEKARGEADALCALGNGPTSAKVRAVEAKLRHAAAIATEAYGMGRDLEIPAGGGVITPMFGGNK